MPNRKRFFKRLLALTVSASLFCTCAWAQEQEQENTRRRASGYNAAVKGERVSDLGKENSQRVAASGVQLRTVLLKDPGILVELKRWIAKEATDSGQVVDDNALTDQAIFDRLDQDVEFRSIATQLVQHYGYLLPTLNPDSEAAKEQDLILKQRARRLVQLEDQEDSGTVPSRQDEPGDKYQQTQERGVERTPCNSRNRLDCGQPTSNRRPSGNSIQDETPSTEPSAPILPDQRSPSDSMRTLRSASGRGTSDFGSADLGVSLASEMSRQSTSQFGSASPGVSAGGIDDVDRLLRQRGDDDLSSLAAGARSESLSSSSNPRATNRNIRMQEESEPSDSTRLAPVTMVHKRNPYADIPSLYDMYVQAAPRDREPERFGMEIFRNGTRQSDAIPMDMPVGPDYVVGPGDGLAINLWGGVSQRLVRAVDREGRITLPEAGPLLVSGRTLGEVQDSVQKVLRTQFRDVSADVSLSRLRTVRVYVVGEVAEPGAYDISSLSTPLNALFAARGITSRGSLRGLKHYRGKQLIEEVDAYELLLHGVSSEVQRLENGDSLLVPPVGPQVTVGGMVRRPAIYELRGEESLADVLELSGGILPAAALRHIEVQRLEAHEKRTMLTLNLSPDSNATTVTDQMSSFKVRDGDEIHIFPIASYNEQAIYLRGHVIRPGRYSYHDGMRLTDLLASYHDLLPEPAAHYAEIVRLNAPDFRPSVESFDLEGALANPAASPKLEPLDTVRVFSRFDFEPAPTVWVGGEVRTPGQFRTSGQAHLRDAIYLAGGIAPDAGLESAQLFRTQSDGTMKIFSVNLGQALAGNPVDNLLLEPRDRVLVHRNSARVDPPTVYVKGEVAKPGRYPLTTNMHVEDLVRTAGGLRRSADPAKADLTHYAVGSLPGAASENVSIELASALGGNGNDNLQLRDGDVLTIRQAPGWNDLGASATVRGEVQHAGSYGIRPGEKLSSLLQRAGGFSPEAYPYGAILMRREVRELQMQSHMALVQRMKSEEVNLKALPEADTDQKNAKLTAIAQTDTVLNQLETNAPIGRVVVHIQPELRQWRNTSADIALRDGDVLVIPKRANYVMVSGQVFNPTAISQRPGRSAQWYLNQAGGLTQMADKKAVFVVRADGSVIAAKNNSGWFSGNPLSAELRPGDSIVVPEKAAKIGTRNWATALQAAQLATSVALTVAYFKP